MSLLGAKVRSFSSSHSAFQLDSSPNGSSKKLTVVSRPSDKKKQSTAVSFKNAFRNILLCEHARNNNEEEV